MKDDELHILMLEDEPLDAELAERELRRAGLRFSAKRVENEDDYRVALKDFAPDIILSDYQLPAFDGLSALKIAREACTDVPFIFVSGVMGDEKAIETLKQGAMDYVLKDKLVRLAPAVERALLETEKHIEQKRAEIIIRKRNQDLSLINTLNDASNREAGIDEILSLASSEIKKIFSVFGVMVLILSQDKKYLIAQESTIPDSMKKAARLVASSQFINEGIRITLAEGGLYRKMLLSREARIISDQGEIKSLMAEFIKSRNVDRLITNAQGLASIKSVMSIPFAVQEELIGMMEILGEGSFTATDLERVKNISKQLTVIIKRRQAEDGRRKNLFLLHEAIGGTIKALAATVESKDPYTAGHQQRVADLARAIADEIGLSKERIDGVRVAGGIHDLGKIHIPAEILSKPLPLSDIEMSFIKTHPRAAYDILHGIEFPWPIAEIVLQHHERMDGSGYPAGLSGEQIILESRILAVADVVEAMASHRPYRPALGIDEALDEISQNKDILYYPVAVDACLRLFNEERFVFDGGFLRETPAYPTK